MKTLVLILDLAGTFVFALAGATAGARRQLDIFGVLVLAFAAACAGGIVRDVLIGATPPAAITDWRFLAASVLAGVIAFKWHAAIERMANPVRMFDAAGLALFAVAGTQKALAYELNPVMAALLGMLTGIGGGVVRDCVVGANPVGLASRVVCRGRARRSDGRGAGRSIRRAAGADRPMRSRALFCFTRAGDQAGLAVAQGASTAAAGSSAALKSLPTPEKTPSCSHCRS